jgi:hypothetical protein
LIEQNTCYYFQGVLHNIKILAMLATIRLTGRAGSPLRLCQFDLLVALPAGGPLTLFYPAINKKGQYLLGKRRKKRTRC